MRNGFSYVEKSREFLPNPRKNSFVTLHAPRTAVGILNDGSIFLAVADGVEALDQGPDLFEFAEILQSQGATQAINLDGGGSTTMVLSNRVWNFANCDDLAESFCERAVTTAACIKYPSSSSYSLIE